MRRGDQGKTSPSAPLGRGAVTPAPREKPGDLGRAEDKQHNKASRIVHHCDPGSTGKARPAPAREQKSPRKAYRQNELTPQVAPCGEEGGRQGSWEVVPPKGTVGRTLLPSCGCSPVPALCAEPAAQHSPVRASQPISVAWVTVTSLLPQQSHLQCHRAW